MDSLRGLKAVALYRVSTDRQDEALQRNSVRNFCKTNSVALIDEYVEHDVSGYQTKFSDRIELIKVLLRAEQEKDYNILLIFNQDRLTRRSEDLPQIIRTLSDNKIRCFETYNGTEIKTETHADTLMNFVSGWMAEWESIKTSMRVKSALANLNTEGKFLGGVPFGYKTVDTNMVNKRGKKLKIINVDTEESKIVRLIFDLYVNKNMGTVMIANYLNRNNYLTRAKKKKLNHGLTTEENKDIFRPTTIIRILRNRTYIGEKVYNKYNMTRDKRLNNSKDEYKTQPYNDKLRIIEDNIFYQAQDLLERRKKRKGKEVNTSTISEQALCSGLVYCQCGTKLRTGYSISKYHRQRDNQDVKLKVYYYFCPNAKVNKEKHEKITKKKTYSVIHFDKIVDQIVLNKIKNFNADKFKKKQDNKRNKNAELHDQDLTKLKIESGKIKSLIEKYEIAIDECFIDGQEGKAEIYINNINRNKAKLDELEIKIKELTTIKNIAIKKQTDSDNIIKLFEGLEERYKNASLQEKKAILNILIEKIVLTENDVVIDSKLPF